MCQKLQHSLPRDEWVGSGDETLLLALSGNKLHENVQCYGVIYNSSCFTKRKEKG